MITAVGLAKHYRVHRRDPGVLAALRSVFHRRYDLARAVDGVSFHIEKGERVGFLGPNGAGKTTTLKVLAGLLHPTAGSVTVAGHVPQRREDAYLRRIMLVAGQKQQLLWDLPPIDTFELNRVIYGVPQAAYDAALRELTELLELGDLVKKPTRQLSLGERMKCELAAALLHAPDVLFLDEPTIGLDVTMQVVVRDFVRRYCERHGATLLLTSHYMDDVEALCDRVIVIDRGKLVFDGALDALRERAKPEKRVTLRLARAATEVDGAGLGAVVLVLREGPKLVLRVAKADVSAVLARALAELPVVDLSVEDPPLEDVMRDLFARHGEAP